MSEVCKIFVVDDDIMYSEILTHYLSMNRITKFINSILQNTSTSTSKNKTKNCNT